MSYEDNDVHLRLKAFIAREIIGNANYDIGDDEPLISGGLVDSFSLAQIGVFAEEAFGVYIPDNDLTVENMDTLRQIVGRIMQDMEK